MCNISAFSIWAGKDQISSTLCKTNSTVYTFCLSCWHDSKKNDLNSKLMDGIFTLDADLVLGKLIKLRLKKEIKYM